MVRFFEPASKWNSAFCGGIILITCSLFAVAQQPLKTLLVGVDHRTVTSLDGDWHYLVDQPPFGSLYSGDGRVRDNGYPAVPFQD
jgi:beta-glucuronidase